MSLTRVPSRPSSQLGLQAQGGCSLYWMEDLTGALDTLGGAPDGWPGSFPSMLSLPLLTSGLCPPPSDPGKGGGMIRPLGYWRNAAVVSGGQQDKAGRGPLAPAQPTGREAEQIHRSCNCLDLRTTATQGSEFFPGSYIAKPREQECLADRQGTEAQGARPVWGQIRSRAELGGNPRQPPIPPLSPPAPPTMLRHQDVYRAWQRDRSASGTMHQLAANRICKVHGAQALRLQRHRGLLRLKEVTQLTQTSMPESREAAPPTLGFQPSVLDTGSDPDSLLFMVSAKQGQPL